MSRGRANDRLHGARLMCGSRPPTAAWEGHKNARVCGLIRDVVEIVLRSASVRLCWCTDRVQFQHSAQLMKALTESGVLYETQIYDRIDLETMSVNTQHLYQTMSRFLLNYCWFKAPTDVTTSPSEHSDVVFKDH